MWHVTLGTLSRAFMPKNSEKRHNLDLALGTEDVALATQWTWYHIGIRHCILSSAMSQDDNHLLHAPIGCGYEVISYKMSTPIPASHIIAYFSNK